MPVKLEKAAVKAAVSAVLLAGIGLSLLWWHRPAPTGVAPEVGSRAPALTLRDLSGQTATLSQYRGKVVLLDFWATWCTNCVEELPWLKSVHASHKARGFEILGVSVDEDGRKVLLPFVAQYSVPWRILLADMDTAQSYGVTFLPTKFLIDRKGVVARKYLGPIEPQELEKDIQSLL